MDLTANCPLAGVLADRMRVERAALTRRWLDRIVERVAIDPNRVFPTEELLDHVPLLIDGIADYIADPARTVSADMPVIGKAMELGALRHAQGFDEYEIMKEYEIFGGILFSFLTRTVGELDQECSRAELLVCAHRLFQALALIQQASLTHFLRLMKEQLGEREARLRGFNRTLTHELRNRIGAVMGAAQLLEEIPAMPEEQRRRLLDVILRNASSMRGALDNLAELSKLDRDTRQQRHVLLPRAVAEVARGLRDMARADGVEIRIGELPNVEIPAAAVELALTNLVSNAIKYSNRERSDRWVEIGVAAERADADCEIVLVVRDNGIGVPADKRAHLFERFFRAHENTVTGVEGTGLGLSIVRETIESIGGRAWAEFSDVGSSFSIALPCRRAADRTAGVEPARSRSRSATISAGAPDTPPASR